MSTFTNILRVMEEQQVTVRRLCEGAGISTGNFYDWKSGRAAPKLPSLEKIARFLGVPLARLTGGDEPGGEADDFLFALSGEVRDLTSDEKQQVRDFVAFLRARRAKEAGDNGERTK